MTNVILLLIVLDSILILGILTSSGLEKHFNDFEIIQKLKEIYFDDKNNFNFISVVTSLGALVTLLLFHLRNKAMTAQTKSQYNIFNEDKQFSNYLEATKLLTGKDSTVEAKIAAMFSLADVAKAHPEHLDRVIQVINKELTPIIKAIIDGKNDTNKCVFTLQEKKIVKKRSEFKKETELFYCTQNKTVSYNEWAPTNQEKIKNWQYNGNDTEKVISVALYVIRKIILELEKNDSKFDFSNTILFDIDVNFDKKRIENKFIRKDNKRIENAIFLDCKLNGVDFSETNFHFCKFINCDLSNVNFYDANLWGTSFKNCFFEDAKFHESECEGLEFIDCKELTIEQIKEMSFVNIKKYPLKNNYKYLIIIDDNTLKTLNDKSIKKDNFINKDEYNKWKNSAKDKGKECLRK